VSHLCLFTGALTTWLPPLKCVHGVCVCVRCTETKAAAAGISDILSFKDSLCTTSDDGESCVVAGCTQIDTISYCHHTSMRGDKENVNLHRQLVLFIYYDIIHEVQSNIKRNEFLKNKFFVTTYPPV